MCLSVPDSLSFPILGVQTPSSFPLSILLSSYLLNYISLTLFSRYSWKNDNCNSI
jgi:hypothetical protein